MGYDSSGLGQDSDGGGQQQPTMSMGEEDVVQLCRLGIAGLRNIVRPDIARVAEAFNELMAAVKVQACSCLDLRWVVAVLKLPNAAEFTYTWERPTIRSFVCCGRSRTIGAHFLKLFAVLPGSSTYHQNLTYVLMSMYGARQRRSRERHRDLKIAFERCFAGFAGRGKTRVSVHQVGDVRSYGIPLAKWCCIVRTRLVFRTSLLVRTSPIFAGSAP